MDCLESRCNQITVGELVIVIKDLRSHSLGVLAGLACTGASVYAGINKLLEIQNSVNPDYTHIPLIGFYAMVSSVLMVSSAISATNAYSEIKKSGMLDLK